MEMPRWTEYPNQIFQLASEQTRRRPPSSAFLDMPTVYSNQQHWKFRPTQKNTHTHIQQPAVEQTVSTRFVSKIENGNTAIDLNVGRNWKTEKSVDSYKLNSLLKSKTNDF